MVVSVGLFVCFDRRWGGGGDHGCSFFSFPSFLPSFLSDPHRPHHYHHGCYYTHTTNPTAHTAAAPKAEKEAAAAAARAHERLYMEGQARLVGLWVCSGLVDERLDGWVDE